MKLISLVIESFGALSKGEWALGGSSAVLLGKNEAGKTTFVDALLCVLYGPPGGRDINDKRFFTERYGDPKSWGKLEALLAKGGKSSPAAPKGPGFADKELFRRLLVLRAGECFIELPAESGFLPAFSQRLMGGGMVDIQSALKELEGVSSTQANRAWQKHANGLEKQHQELKAKLDQAGRVETAGKRAQELTAESQEAKSKKEALKASLAGLQTAEDRLKAQTLRELKAKWEEARDRVLKSKPSDAAPIEELRYKAETAKRLETEAAMAAEALRQKQNEKRKRERQAEEAKAQAEKLPKKERLLRVRGAMQALVQAQALAGRGSKGLSPAARLVIAVLAGVAAGAVAHVMVPGIWPPFIASVAALALGWWIGDRLMSMSSSEDPAEELEKAQNDFDYAAEALGWKALALAEIEKRLDDSARQEAELGAKLETAAQELKEAADGADALADDVSAKEKAHQEAVRSRNEALATWGTSTVQEAEDRENLAKTARQVEEDRRDDLRRLLGAPGLAEEAVGEKVRLRVEELSAGPEPSAELAKLSEKDLEAERKRVEGALAQEEKVLERLAGESREVESDLNQGKGALGDPARLHEEVLGLERRIKNLRLWRDAAVTAHGVVSGLATDLDTRVKTLVEEAGPLYQRLSGGRYEKVALTGKSVFESDSLSVTHKDLGQKGTEWLSSGAADLLWLSLRITMARRAFPEGGLMVLDEPFLTLDLERTKTAAEALLKDADLKSWQFVILTKDERTAELAKAAGAKGFDLG